MTVYPFNLDDAKILLSGRYNAIQHLPFSKQQILDSSKLKEFADNNFKSVENCRKFLKQVQNILGKEENARYEQFFLFLHYFQKDLYCRYVKTRACLGKG